MRLLTIMGGISDKIKQKAIFYTDHWDAYNIIPYKQRIVKRGGINHIERLFLTLRNDNPRFVRKTIRFPKSLEMLQNSIKLWIHYHNLSIRLKIISIVSMRVLRLKLLWLLES